MDKKKILVIGYGRGGKDTLAEYLRDNYDYKFTSSSYYACKKFIYNKVKTTMAYSSIEECFEDRHKYRDLWFSLISAYNTPDKSLLARSMIEDGYDMYVGMRCIEELRECLSREIFDYIIWVDGVERTGYVENSSSCTITSDLADFTITNNSTLEDFYENIDKLMEKLA